ncbi:MAG: hypothetical protein U1D41_01740 [Nitrosomonas sp.]|uniref:hypothetical protein n=1 Tax=Nitrosomonas sp. TaxID=42353 RepID=UPI0027336095|nr:hypothetical protein [Nitrosomonas sp.]MDP3663927.1 hypothetical protein [Nitrosomonas sp.]MDZ4104881.1 hypothetical protein [Nitrosomonas sp.]
MSRAKQKSNLSSHETPLKLFIRKLHSNKNLRKGLSDARKITKPENFPLIIKKLSNNQIHDVLLAPITFPRFLSDFTQKSKLQTIATDGELIWCSSILAQHSEKLNIFIRKRDKFYEAFLNCDYKQAENLLIEIQEIFGISIWLIGNRLQLLQATEGLQAQKNFLEELVNINGINQFVAWLAYFLSLRTEDNITYSRFEIETELLLNTKWLHDYALLHLLPYKFNEIADPGTSMAMEEPHPIIDRFETFVAMSLLYCVKYGRSRSQILVSALEQIENIEDTTLRNILMVLRDGYAAIDFNVLKLADAYTEGRYEEIVNSNCECLELMARAYTLTGQRPLLEGSPGLRQQAIALMCDVLSITSEAAQSRESLKKIALIGPSRSFTFQISAFLERDRKFVIANDSTGLDLLSTLSSPLDNPWSTSVLQGICGEEKWLDQLLKVHPNSPALKLRQALTTRNEWIIKHEMIQLPWYRRAMYLGHIYFEKGDFNEAISSYHVASNSEIDFVAHSAKRYLFEAYKANGQLYESAQLAINQIVQFPSTAQSYPLDSLANEYLNQLEYRESMDLAVLISLAIRFSSAKLERDLSNIFENVLAHEGIIRPNEFSAHISKYNRERLIYFLRYICIPRIFDDTITFNTVEEIDNERIAVCQLLLQLDPTNLLAYQAEIRALTRENEVANLLTKIQTSKIFVDEAGIREVLDASLHDLLTRYQKLLDSPTLAYQAEKLSKRLIEMLDNKGHPEFKDLKLPASEIESLFSTILLEVASEFALNPAYGLDTHVSTSIRHGAFEGHLRSPLAVEDLLCLKKDKDYFLPPLWLQKLPHLADQEFELLQKLLAKFTQRVEEIIAEYLKEKLHVRLLGKNVAMFNFEGNSTEIQGLMDLITPRTTSNELADRLINYCWNLTSRSLDKIRADLLNYAAKQIGLAFDNLIKGIESRIERSKVTSLMDSIARARTGFQVAIEDVAEWFQRPTDLSREPFDIEIAIHVALQQIANCYIKNPIEPELDLANITEKIDGKMLDGLCEILFILLQNVILHSGVGENKAKVFISASRSADYLVLECKNGLGEEISLTECLERAQEAMRNYQHDSALSIVRKEGGSGLSKVWRIAEFDLNVTHNLQLIVTDNREFIVRLTLKGI